MLSPITARANQPFEGKAAMSGVAFQGKSPSKGKKVAKKLYSFEKMSYICEVQV